MLTRLNVFILAAVLPFVYGCLGGDGGSGSQLGGFVGQNLGGGEGITGGGVSSGISGFSDPGVSAAALSLSSGSLGTITNPEPASMLLIGGGIAAMAYYRRKK